MMIGSADYLDFGGSRSADVYLGSEDNNPSYHEKSAESFGAYSHYTA